MGDETFDAAIGRYYEDNRQSGGAFGTLLEYAQREPPNDLGDRAALQGR